MRWLVVSFAVALAPYAANAEQQKQGEQTKQDSSERQQGKQSSADKTSTEGDDKTYGQYGNDPGTEARSGAKQASDPQREMSKAPQDERRDGPQKAQTLKGSIVKATASSLSLKGDDRKVHQLRITEETEVLRGTNPVDISDLKEGEEVRASFGGSGESMVAKKITVGEDASRQPASVVDKKQGDQQRMGGATPEAR